VPTAPTAALTQKIDRHSQADRTPPSTSPRKLPASAATWLTPSAAPRRLGGNASVMIAAEFAITIAPPTPCTSRQPISHSAPAPPSSGTSASATAATVKTANPAL
jgi:hypothetical protein